MSLNALITQLVVTAERVARLQNRQPREQYATVLQRASAYLTKLATLLPSGSGIDSGTSIVSIDARCVILSTSFHHMNDSGFYDGWTHHKIKITPTLSDSRGFDLKITGRDRNDIKAYLYDVYFDALAHDVPADILDLQ